MHSFISPLALPFAALCIVLAACGSSAPAAPPQLPPPNVTVLTIVEQRVEEPVEFVGIVEASRRVEVRAQVSGVVEGRPFREGGPVRAGDVLYRIDPTVYAAEWRGARARRMQVEAQLANAVATAGRLRPLLADHAVSSLEVDNAESSARALLAAVDDARATEDRAREGLDRTVVRAEIAGQVGRAALERGGRVTGPADVLTVIDVLDPVYVSFRPSAEQQLRWKRVPALAAAMAPGGSALVQVILADSAPLPRDGSIGYIDPAVDAATGTQQYRATFTNADRLLVPGQFVRVRLRGLTRERAILVPQRAVVQDLGRQSVYVVAAGDTVRLRDVTASAWTAGDWVIERGLTPGDRVVVDGVSKVAPGRLVRATPVGTVPGAPASSPSAGAVTDAR